MHRSRIQFPCFSLPRRIISIPIEKGCHFVANGDLSFPFTVPQFFRTVHGRLSTGKRFREVEMAVFPSALLCPRSCRSNLWNTRKTIFPTRIVFVCKTFPGITSHAKWRAGFFFKRHFCFFPPNTLKEAKSFLLRAIKMDKSSSLTVRRV